MAEQTALAVKELRTWLDKPTVLDQLRRALPNDLAPERLARISLTVIERSKGLKQCSPISLLACVVECAQLGFEPDPIMGEAYLVPFKEQATLLVGYKGFAKLAFQTGDIYKIPAFVVRKGEEYSEIAGSHAALIHVPKDHGVEKDDSTWTHAYAMAFFRDGHTDWQTLERAEVFRRRSRSRAFTSGKKDSPWFTDPEMMWRKSAIRALASRLPKSTKDYRLARAVAIDDLGEAGLLKPAGHGMSGALEGFELSEAAESLNTEEPIKESRETSGKSRKDKKNMDVPKANIPKEGQVIDVRAEKPKSDPPISRAALGRIYEVGGNSGSWNVDTIQSWVKKRFGCKVQELRESQLPEVMRVMESGE